MKILVSDLDGTIIKGKEISDFDRRQIYKFKNVKENKFVIATGRNYIAFKRGIEQYNLDFFDYAVISNGAVIIDKSTNVIYEKTMEEKSVYEILNFAAKNINTIEAIYVSTLEIEKRLDSKEEIISYINEDLQSIKDKIIDLTIELPTSDIEIAKTLAKEIESLPHSKNTSVSRNSRFIDIVHAGISKRSSADKIIQKYGYKQDDIITIGDGQNDINMLSMTNNSFTFEECEQIVKDSAKYIVPNIGTCIESI